MWVRFPPGVPKNDECNFAFVIFLRSLVNQPRSSMRRQPYSCRGAPPALPSTTRSCGNFAFVIFLRSLVNPPRQCGGSRILAEGLPLAGNGKFPPSRRQRKVAAILHSSFCISLRRRGYINSAENHHSGNSSVGYAATFHAMEGKLLNDGIHNTIAIVYLLLNR